ncbi:hypothetical protein CC86DRAFT_401751 [Ophiobolus disseminans]|uniref:Uncharacterized protein n=1 Tax=Ophiobolus disseminans TaxID=1469910 RepID=A0A6A7AE95_9PLEO|nr:hypothetical protein CC86DRAFT_401751 [Ophiobolus disseminans]
MPNLSIKSGDNELEHDEDTDYKSAMIHRNSMQSPLLRLPDEIRNKIFASIFDQGVYTFDNYKACLPCTMMHNAKPD